MQAYIQLQSIFIFKMRIKFNFEISGTLDLRYFVRCFNTGYSQTDVE